MPALLGPSPLALLASLLVAAVLAHAAAGGPAAVRAAPAPGRAMDEAALGKKHHDKGHAHGTGIPALEGRRALVTFHGGGGKHDVNEVLAYDLGTGKEWGKLLHDAKHARNLRGLARNLNTNELYVAQAYKDDGAIWTLQLSDSHHHSPKRLLEQKGKRHTYGIALANQDGSRPALRGLALRPPPGRSPQRRGPPPLGPARLLLGRDGAGFADALEHVLVGGADVGHELLLEALDALMSRAERWAELCEVMGNTAKERVNQTGELLTLLDEPEKMPIAGRIAVTVGTSTPR